VYEKIILLKYPLQYNADEIWDGLSQDCCPDLPDRPLRKNDFFVDQDQTNPGNISPTLP